ncbi:hypothetical protein ACJX0J_015275, partial [Zea mays]
MIVQDEKKENIEENLDLNEIFKIDLILSLYIWLSKKHDLRPFETVKRNSPLRHDEHLPINLINSNKKDMIVYTRVTPLHLIRLEVAAEGNNIGSGPTLQEHIYIDSSV